MVSIPWIKSVSPAWYVKRHLIDCKRDSLFCLSVIRCAPLQNPHYGMVECDSGNLYGSTCTISCIPGYSIVGHDRITCKQDGHWSDDIPFCRSKFFISLRKVEVSNPTCHLIRTVFSSVSIMNTTAVSH